MENFDRKQHWDKIYNTKQLNEVSWYEPTPKTSLDFVEKFKLSKTAKIIDIGGGDSFFVDHLLAKGYKNITVLDISEVAIERAKKRLGNKAENIKWIIADATKFRPIEKYDFWNDRAAFHFLIKEQEISKYLEIAENSISSEGIMVIGTFSIEGPKKCSGIEIKQYSENSMTERSKHYFEKIECIKVDHPTPFDTFQKFVFCSFKKLRNS